MEQSLIVTPIMWELILDEMRNTVMFVAKSNLMEICLHLWRAEINSISVCVTIVQQQFYRNRQTKLEKQIVRNRELVFRNSLKEEGKLIGLMIFS